MLLEALLPRVWPEAEPHFLGGGLFYEAHRIDHRFVRSVDIYFLRAYFGITQTGFSCVYVQQLTILRVFFFHK